MQGLGPDADGRMGRADGEKIADLCILFGEEVHEAETTVRPCSNHLLWETDSFQFSKRAE